MSKFSDISRRPTVDPTDKQYKIATGEHFSKLSHDSRQSLINSISKEECCSLANALLHKASEVNQALNRQGDQYPATGIFETWIKKPGSTIWVLKGTLTKLGLQAALDILDKARYDYVELYLVIHFSKGDHKKFNLMWPGSKPLVEIVRPLTNRYNSFELTQRGTIQILRLNRLNSEDTWKSSAKDFKGQQVNIYIDTIRKDTTRPQTDSGRQTEERIRVARNVVSWVDQDILYFEYDDMEPQETPGDVDKTSQNPVQVSGEEGKSDLYARIERLSLTSDQEATDCESIDKRIEESNEDTLRDHLIREGDYVVQQNQVAGVSTLKLAVRHNDEILQYQIFQCPDHVTCYSINGKSHHTAKSPDELCQLYTSNSWTLPGQTSCADEESGDNVCLKRQVGLND